MITIGAYVQGSDPEVDQAIKQMPGINNVLRQDMFVKKDLPSSVTALKAAVENKK